MKLLLVRCKKADLLQAYCCLQQARVSISHAQTLDEVQQYLNERQTYYDVPLVTETSYLTHGDKGTDCTASQDVLRFMGLWLSTRVHFAYMMNRFRGDAIFIDVLSLRQIQSCFQRLRVFLASDSASIDDAYAVRRDLADGLTCISWCLGREILNDATRIENLNQSPRLKHFTFEEVLAREK